MDQEQLEHLLAEAEKVRAKAGSTHDCDQIFAAAYEALEVPPAIRRLVHQGSPDGYDTWIPALFPPCGVPLWATGGGSLICEWRHWFTTRRPVIASFEPGMGTATERARNYLQISYLILQNLVEVEDEVTPEIERMAGELGVEDIDEVERRWEDEGDLASAFSTHPAFVDDLPQSCFDSDLEDYGGDFPAPRSGALGDLSQTCSFELHGRFEGGRAVLEPRREAAASSSSPPWLRAAEQPEVFARLLADGDLAGAWMSLCSSGWTYGEAKKALDELAAAQDDLRFDIQATCWCALPFDENERY